MNDKESLRCKRCEGDVLMVKQDYKEPYILPHGKIIRNINTDVYICPNCGAKVNVLPNEFDGYSLGQGLFSE